MDCSPPGSSVHGDSPGKNTCQTLLQGIFPTQGSNPSLPHGRRILHCEPPGKPMITAAGSRSLLQGIFPGMEPGSPALQADSLRAELPVSNHLPPPHLRQRARSFPVPRGNTATGGTKGKLALSGEAGGRRVERVSSGGPLPLGPACSLSLH